MSLIQDKKGERYRCNQCGRYFVTREEMIVHDLSEHEKTEEFRPEVIRENRDLVEKPI